MVLLWVQLPLWLLYIDDDHAVAADDDYDNITKNCE